MSGTIDSRYSIKRLLRNFPLDDDPAENNHPLNEQTGPVVSPEEIEVQAEKLAALSTGSAQAMLEACSNALPLLPPKEFPDWVSLACKILHGADPSSKMGELYFQASPAVLAVGPLDTVKTWVDLGLRLAGRSLETAEEFFLSTPAFLKNGRVGQMREWADWAAQTLALSHNGGEIGASFLRNTALMLEFMSFRELKDWKALGFLLARTSPDLASAYLSAIPDGLERLYRYERNALYRFCSPLAETFPDQAADFFAGCPQILLGLNPAIRMILLDLAHGVCHGQPENAREIFNGIVAVLTPLPYPTQKMALEQGAVIGKVAPRACAAYFKNIRQILDYVSDEVLPYFVERGLARSKKSEDRCLDYFSLGTADADAELSRWREAVLLEDHRRLLALMAQALTGREINIISSADRGFHSDSLKKYYPAGDGDSIFLPPVMADETSRQDNFRAYKMAAVHQTGYIEFGTFRGGINVFRKLLRVLPQNKLAADIFLILEDGRIDYRLKLAYRGLVKDLDQTLRQALRRRPSPLTLPAQEALVEILLRLTIGLLTPEDIPPNLAGHVNYLRKTLAGFYHKDTGIKDCFHKAMELYAYLSRLPNLVLPPLDSEDALAGRPEKTDLVSYSQSEPMPFRGKLEPDSLAEPLEIEVSSHEWIDAEAVSPMSEEDLQQLLETLKETSLLQIMEQDEPSGAQGVFIDDPEGIAAKGGPNEPNAENFDSLNRAYASEVSGLSLFEGPFFYDEWDYQEKKYRKRWCRLREMPVQPLDPTVIEEISARHAGLIQRVRKQFQRIRPEVLEIVRKVEWGDEIDLEALIQGVVDRKTGNSPSDKIFVRREKRIRKISTLLLMDMSASTDEFIPDLTTDQDEDQPADQTSTPENQSRKQKIIDIEKESLVVIMEALEALNDEYAIFGFSGYGKDRVDFYRIKDFSDPYSAATKAGISGIEPKQSTRMGAAIRHAVSKMKRLESDQRLLILLSDGFPQDHDYGEDRSSIDYGLHDTMMALLEAKKEGIRPFCITVDQSGNDYLRKMCDPDSYLIIKDVWSLPAVLPNIVESLMF